MAARPPGRKGVGRAGACARLAGQARAQARLPDGAGKDRAAKLSGIGQPGAGRLSGPGRSASRIFLPAALGDADAVTAARKQAQDLVKRAQAPKADFAALAQSYSRDDTSRTQGGDIGFVPLAQLMPAMRPVIEQMKEGEVSAPVQSAAGFHILKLSALRPASVTPNWPRGPIWRAC
ncbi:hypothetical protein G6F31_018719 [Rhizopus arrhizus]|nr:hypothetical protein G6F31_018719 [Rhizopus arrhizus]